MNSREKCRVQREAYVAGYLAGRRYVDDSPDTGGALRLAAVEFPMPRVERPRVISREVAYTCVSSAPRTYFSVVGGRLLYSYHESIAPHWDFAESLQSENHGWSSAGVTIALDAYAELVKQPTEWVDADE